MGGPRTLSAPSEAARRTQCLVRLRWAAMVGLVVALELADHAMLLTVSWVPICVTLALLGPYNLLLSELVGRSGLGLEAAGRGQPAPVPSFAERVAAAPAHLFRAWLAAGNLTRAIAGWVGIRPRRDPERTHRPTLSDLLVPREYWGMDGEDEILRISLLAGGQLTVDVAALAALAHFGGGLESPLAYCAPIPVLVAGTILSRRATGLLAGFGLLLFSLVGFGEMAGVLHHHPQPLLGELEMYGSSLFVVGQSIVLGALLFLTAFLSTGSAAERHSLEREVAILRDEDARREARRRAATAGAAVRPHARIC